MGKFNRNTPGIFCCFFRRRTGLVNGCFSCFFGEPVPFSRDRRTPERFRRKKQLPPAKWSGSGKDLDDDARWGACPAARQTSRACVSPTAARLINVKLLYPFLPLSAMTKPLQNRNTGRLRGFGEEKMHAFPRWTGRLQRRGRAKLHKIVTIPGVKRGMMGSVIKSGKKVERGGFSCQAAISMLCFPG